MPSEVGKNLISGKKTSTWILRLLGFSVYLVSIGNHLIGVNQTYVFMFVLTQLGIYLLN